MLAWLLGSLSFITTGVCLRWLCAENHDSTDEAGQPGTVHQGACYISPAVSVVMIPKVLRKPREKCGRNKQPIYALPTQLTATHFLAANRLILCRIPKPEFIHHFSQTSIALTSHNPFVFRRKGIADGPPRVPLQNTDSDTSTDFHGFVTTNSFHPRGTIQSYGSTSPCVLVARKLFAVELAVPKVGQILVHVRAIPSSPSPIFFTDSTQGPIGYGRTAPR